MSTFIAPLVQETNSLQANEENLKIFGTDENIRLFLERISCLDYKSEEEKSDDKTNIEPFYSISEQSNLSKNEEKYEDLKRFSNTISQNDKFTEKKSIFETIYPRKIFSYSKNISVDESFKKLKHQKRKRCKDGRECRKKNQDNIRRVFKRRLTNTYLLKVLNKELKKLGYNHKVSQEMLLKKIIKNL